MTKERLAGLFFIMNIPIFCLDAYAISIFKNNCEPYYSSFCTGDSFIIFFSVFSLILDLRHKDMRAQLISNYLLNINFEQEKQQFEDYDMILNDQSNREQNWRISKLMAPN